MKQWASTLRVLSHCLDWLTVAAALVCLVALVLYEGFDRSVITYSHIKPWLRMAQAIFAVNVVFNLTLRFKVTVRENRVLKWIVDFALLLTLIPWIYPHPTNPWFPALDKFIYSKALLACILAAYSLVYLCFAIIRSLSKRTNPALILSTSFLLLIGVGTLLLLLPRSTIHGISPIDSFFVSTSAVCICGLTTVDVPTTFTPMGMAIIAIMMQVGALGVMTFTSSFALFFSGNASVYSQLMVKDMFYSKTINSLLPTLLYVLMLTLSIEALGAIGIYWGIHGTLPGYSMHEEIMCAIFHSISAFCNAGFSTIPDGMSNRYLMHGNQLIYLFISVLVIAGGIGFPILVNVKDAVHSRLRSFWRKTRYRWADRRPHLYDMNSRVAMLTSAILGVITIVLFFIFENNNSLAGMSPYEKLVQSIFNSVTPRSAGFVSVNPAGFLPVTLLLVMFMMWIGAGSQSTAGGIKVNTFAAAWLHLRAVVTGRRQVRAFNGTVSAASLSRAQAVIFLSILSYVIFSGIILLLHPHLPAKVLLFETLSALFTVGSSLGATPLLSWAGKLLLCIAMFVGRVGLLSLLCGIVDQKKDPPVGMPEENLIIN